MYFLAAQLDSDAADRSHVDGFIVEYRPYEGPMRYSNMSLPNPQSRDAVISGLWPGTSYSLRMAAFNSAGRGEYSSDVVKTTLGDAPGL